MRKLTFDLDTDVRVENRGIKLGLRLPQRLGVDYSRRGQSCQNSGGRRILPDPVTFRSPRVIIDNAAVLPRPVSKIPVLLGGGAVQRIAQRADGWLPLLTTPGPAAELRASWDRLRESASQTGRDTSQMEMVVVGNVTFTDCPAGPKPIRVRWHTRPNHGRVPRCSRRRSKTQKGVKSVS